MQMEAILQKASSSYVTHYKRSESDSTFTFWKKHLAYKTDPLNNIIESHLKAVTKRSNLIFTVHKGKGNDFDSDSDSEELSWHSH